MSLLIAAILVALLFNYGWMFVAVCGIIVMLSWTFFLTMYYVFGIYIGY